MTPIPISPDTIYDIVPPIRSAYSPASGIWLLALAFVGFFLLLYRWVHRTPRSNTVMPLLRNLLKEVNTSSPDFVLDNMGRISRLLRRAGASIGMHDLESKTATELAALLNQYNSINDGIAVNKKVELLRILILFESIRYSQIDSKERVTSEELQQSLQKLLTLLNSKKETV